VAKSELGTKRLCASCGAKFYDLNKDPIVCPKCETVFVVPVVTTRATRADAARAEPDQSTPASADAEFISLEDADAEAQGKKKTGLKDDDDLVDDDADADDAGDDDTFIEETDDGEDDVTDIIGDAGDKEDEN
jgi:uncharacterized protein (TIGR02300 family)